jgi:hypothetical protein
MHLKRNASHHGQSGGALIAAIIIVGMLALLGGTVYLSALPAYRGTYHAAAWHGARLAADAGIDLGVAAIQKSLPNTNGYAWPGWTKPDGSPVTPGMDGWRVWTPASDLLTLPGADASQPQIVRIEIDVLTRDDNVSRNPLYRIRATGAVDVASSQLGLDKRDLFLRRMALQRGRVTRTVEVITRPVYLWEYALKTKGSMTLGGGTDWKIDSYDSRYVDLTADHRGSTNGMYDIAKSGAFGNIASNAQRPASSPYGVLIDAEGAMVRGEVQTHGGDNPATPNIFENVEESQRIDQTKITSDFDETLLRAENPMAPAVTPQDAALVRRMVAPWGTPNFINPVGTLPSSFGISGGTTETEPVRIMLAPANQTQGGFSVAAPPAGQKRFVEIYINANLVLSGGGIEIPPGVHVKVFVNGDLNFKNQNLNYSAASSRIPGNLQMYGVSTRSTARVDSSGNGHIVGVFYGPQYAGNLDGNTEIIGGFVLNTYNISGGGGSGGDSVGAGFHYDEALGVVGPIQGYRTISYFEDTRKDLD